MIHFRRHYTTYAQYDHCMSYFYFKSKVLFYLCILGTSSLLYKTSDGGIKWTSISSGLPTTQSSYEFKFHAISVGTYTYISNTYLTEYEIL